MSEKVRIQPWKCELSKCPWLDFCGMIEIIDLRFFFSSGAAVYTVSAPRRSPFKVVDESWMAPLQKLFTNPVRSKALKLWNTPFLKELNSQGILFFDKPETERFEYLIVTRDEWIELVATQVEITVTPGGTVHEVMAKYVKEDLSLLKKLTLA